MVVLKFEYNDRYPERTKAEVKAACPYCRGNCNCRTCLQANVIVKVDAFIHEDSTFYMFDFHNTSQH